MIGTLQALIYIRLLLADNDDEAAALEELCRDGYVYTEDFEEHLASPGDDEERPANADKGGAYCKITKKYHEMLPALGRDAFSMSLDDFAPEDDKMVVELPDLYRNGNSARKWIDYVIHYSIMARNIQICNDNVFVGVAIYSLYYEMDGEHLKILADNLLRLYIRRAILENPQNFYGRVYTEDIVGDEAQRVLLERMMKIVLVKALDVLGISASVEDCNLRMHAYEDYTLEDWCERRSARLLPKGCFIEFENVIMERPPVEFVTSYNDKIVLLALIGMIRSGKHVISANCRRWFDGHDFGSVIQLVNTNSNLVGVTELGSWMALGSMLGGIRHQLNYLEIELISQSRSKNAAAISFIESLDSVEIKVILYDFNMPTVCELLGLQSVKRIRNLRIIDRDIFISEENRCTLRSIAGSQKMVNIELYNCNMSLKNFLINHAEILKGKLKALGVARIGNLNDARIRDEVLYGLKLERLNISAVDEETDKGVEQLLSRNIVTRDGFKYLILTDIIVRSVAELRNGLGNGAWPVVLANTKPPGTENKDYRRVCTFFYELF